MCGIAGAVALDAGARPDRERVERISRLIAHRGPDGDGLWVSPSGRAVLAHRRLSVIDIATGAQPMVGGQDRLGLVFNGEIYNYRELREGLEARGAQFRTASDTEVLLRAFERDGAECVHDLRGMFAFAFWDDAQGRLTIARDRIGKKPLYYVVSGGCLYFASSLRALVDGDPARHAIDTEALDAYLTLSYIPAPRTIYQGIRKLEAATILEASGGTMTTRQYWSASTEQAPFDGTYETAVDHLSDMLQEAVALRLRSDVPLGIFLSGGIDSSLVTAIAARQAGKLQTFAIGFDDVEFDETEHARVVAEAIGTEHRSFLARPDLLGTLPALVRHFGEPYADATALATWMLAEESRKHITVALAGDGGDEGFAGYDWYRSALALRRLTRPVPTAAFTLASNSLGGALATAFPGSRRAGRIRRGMALLATEAGGPRFAAVRSFVGPTEERDLYAGDLRAARRSGSWAPGLLPALYDQCPGSPLRRMRYVDMATYLADGLMPKVDVATMAHGLETRAPLLDQQVLEFAMSLPDEWLVGAGSGKRILRSVLDRYLPAHLFGRRKQGFTLPLQRWFGASLRPAVEALATSERLLEGGWFQAEGIRGMLREHTAGARDHSQRLYNLLVLDEWLKRL